MSEDRYTELACLLGYAWRRFWIASFERDNRTRKRARRVIDRLELRLAHAVCTRS